MDNLELIDGYLTGRLNKKEKAAFDEALALDHEFVEEFQDVKEIQEGLRALSRKEALSFLQEVEEEVQNTESTLNNNKMKKTIVAAASVILIAAFSFFTLSNNTEDSTLQSIYQNNFESYDNIYGIVRGENEKDASLASQAFNAYDMGDYDLAASSFEELVVTDRTAINYFYMGLSNLEAKNIDLAIKNLNATINNFEDFDAQASWYLALAHLSNDDEEAAISSLVGLTLDNSIYKSKAEAVLKEMGLSISSLDGGVITDVKLRPKEDNAPNGVFDDRRRIQFGIAVSETDGKKYRFLTDQPIYGLHIGSEVEMIVVRRSIKDRAGFAFILGER